MKIECVKEKFEEVVGKACRFTGRNESLPVLTCLYIEAKKNTLLIRATNLDVGVEIHFPAKVEKEGTIAVPGAVLRNLLSGIGKEKKITLEKIHENLSIISPNNTSLIKCFSVEDFPTIPKVTGREVFDISHENFKNGIESVWYSASPSPVKPNISSVYMYKESNEIIFAATDSFRLGEKSIPLKNDVNFTSAILPYQNIIEIMKALEGGSGSITINSSKNQISFQTDETYITSRLIDGVFPDYRQIIPKKFTTEVVMLKNDLFNAVKVTNIFADKFSKVLFKVSVKGKRFEVEARNSDVGENTTRVDASISGEDIQVGFNYRYILDVLHTLPEDSVTLQFSGEGKAMVIRGIGNHSFTYLVMPMNK